MEISSQSKHTQPIKHPTHHWLRESSQIIYHVLQGRSLSGMKLDRYAGEQSVHARINNVVHGTLRDYGRGDFCIKHIMTRKPLKNQRLHALLLVALYRMRQNPKEAKEVARQAVKVAVAIAPYLGPVANHVLREFLKQKDKLESMRLANDESAYCYPHWWVKRLKQDHPRHWQNILMQGDVPPPLVLRINLQKISLADFITRLSAQGFMARHLEGAAVCLERPIPLRLLPGLEEGLFSVQDLGAQKVAPLLGVSAGMRVLDACAAPGGKSAHLMEMNPQGVELLMLDIEAQRMQQVQQNFQRLGLVGKFKVVDCRKIDEWWDGQPFQRILADLPCSGSGVVRRHPDIKWLRRQSDIPRLAQTQLEILEALWCVLAMGGRLLYATCSIFSEENEEVIRQFCRRHDEAIMHHLPNDGVLPIAAEHDGFYCALLEKRKINE